MMRRNWATKDVKIIGLDDQRGFLLDAVKTVGFSPHPTADRVDEMFRCTRMGLNSFSPVRQCIGTTMGRRSK